LKSELIDYMRNNRSQVLKLLLLFAAVAALAVFSSLRDSGTLISDKDGSIVAIEREDNGTYSAWLRIRGSKNGAVTEKDILLEFRGASQDDPGAATGSDGEVTGGESSEADIERSIDDAVRDVEDDERITVKLPSETSDGVKLNWSRKRNWDRPVMIMMLFPAAIILMYRGEADRRKKRAAADKECVLRAMPGFSSQLILLLNSGLILDDAIGMIAEGMKRREGISAGGENLFFSKMIIDIAEKSSSAEGNIASVLDDNARKLGIREFSRLAGIIRDNLFKGVGLQEKLEEESFILWNQRKKAAEEKGRLAETRLTFPLALLLIVLILITAAPAILTM
jgi:Bacterial type II secretion system protein F domain.